MSQFTLYHNPRCSKSRQTLQLLEENGMNPDIVLYLETPPDAETIKLLLNKLGIDARGLLRKGEQAYKEQNLGDTSLTEEELIIAMVNDPKLIERPIVVRDQSAVLGRPPENVLGLL